MPGFSEREMIVLETIYGSMRGDTEFEFGFRNEAEAAAAERGILPEEFESVWADLQHKVQIRLDEEDGHFHVDDADALRAAMEARGDSFDTFLNFVWQQ